MSTPRNYSLAAFLASVVFAGWPLSDAFLKLAREAHVSLGEILFVAGIASMVSIAIACAFRGTLSHLRPHRWGGLMVLGLCQLAGFLSWMIALPHLPLANMYVVSFLTPMTVTALASLILKERLGWKRGVAIAAGFAGVVVAVNPANLFQHVDSRLANLLLFGNMLFSTAQMFLLRVVAEKEKSESTAFYSRFVLAMGGLALCLWFGTTGMKPWALLMLCASGVLGGLGWTLLAHAYKHAPVAAVAPFQYSQMIWGALLGYLIWNENPDVYLAGGSAIIIASGVYLFRHERRISRSMPRVD